MSYKEIKVIERRIIDLFARISTLLRTKNRDDEVISDLTKLLCILISGLIEKKIVEIIKGYVTKRSCVEIQKFINHSLIGTTNLKIERIEKIVGRFNSDWEDEIKNLDHYQEYEASLNYIIGNRNIIAHGGNSGVTIRDLEANFEIIKDFISKIEDIYSVYT